MVDVDPRTQRALRAILYMCKEGPESTHPLEEMAAGLSIPLGELRETCRRLEQGDTWNWKPTPPRPPG